MEMPSHLTDLYRRPRNVQTHWASFENPTGAKGLGGRENRRAKGHAFDSLNAGSTRVLLDIQGCGIVHRMWLTFRERSREMLRGLRLDMFWDNRPTPAISVPLGDFFSLGAGYPVPFENALFSSPEGRSFNTYVPMPFRTAARITIANDTDMNVDTLFYEVDYSLVAHHPDDVQYFHACWRRENPTRLGEDFTILPKVHGSGRYLGAAFCVITDPIYADSWWGEGEVKLYLDHDDLYPTLVNTGTEDYVGTGWGQNTFNHRYQGSLVADVRRGIWSFYRLHIPDPVYFDQDCRATIQQIGGAQKEKLLELKRNGARVQPVSAERDGLFIKLLDTGQALEDEAIRASDWCNFYRQDDWSAVAYFYLDAPENGLNPLARVEQRLDLSSLDLE